MFLVHAENFRNTTIAEVQNRTASKNYPDQDTRERERESTRMELLAPR